MSIYLNMLLVSGLVAGVHQAGIAYERNLRLPDLFHSNVELSLLKDTSEFRPSNDLQVFVGSRDTCCEGRTPITGRYRIDSHTVTFDPAFEFVKGQKYTVLVRNRDATKKGAHELSEFTIQPSDENKSPEVVAVYPSGNSIPENALRFYIHFSKAMKPHMSNQYIKLVDGNGNADTAAFMSFKQELWSKDRKRLTLLMDPGRIKRGVAQNRELGPALLEGNFYSIVVEQGWPDATGMQITPRFEKEFKVSRALRTLPDVGNWQLTSVKAFSREPLTIEFDRSFDHELAQSAITVRDQYGESVEGEVTISANEKGWRFDPSEPWTTAKTLIVVDPQLEDVAGNNFSELLDHAFDIGSRNQIQNNTVLEINPLIELSNATGAMHIC